MSEHDDDITLRQILDHAREASDLIRDRDQQALSDDRVLNLAVTRLLSIVGEAATRLSRQRRDELSQLPWRQIIGLRNVLVHVYELVDDTQLWSILTTDVPLLIRELDKLRLPEEAE